MKLSSFRLKIALLSGLITGLLLIGSGVALWRITYRFNLDRLDREILNLGQGNLNREHGPTHYQRFEGALSFISGEDPPRSFLILVRDQQSQVVYVSQPWPTNLAVNSFPQLTGPLVTHHRTSNTSPAPPPQWPPPPLDRPPLLGQPPLAQKAPHFETRIVNGQAWRFGIMGNAHQTLVLGKDIGQFNADMLHLRRVCLLALPVALLLAGLSAWFLAQRALRPVTVLTRTAERVTARGLDQRIPAMPRDLEFNRLITVFNEMMDRLQSSFSQAMRFSADASHELKTPLARLQVELEQALESAPSSSAQQEVYSSLLDEIHRLNAIVQKLLLLSLADAGQLQLKRVPVNLTRLLENVIEDCQAQAPNLKVEHDLAPDVQINADADLLEQSLQNLASNAIKYNRPDGRIRFELATVTDSIFVRVANTGPGIPATDRDRVFERFYRGDPSRNDRVEGVGLGLSLAREIVRSHGGEMILESSDDKQTSFLVTLPGPNNACG